MTVDLVPSWAIGDLSLTSYPFGVVADSSVDIGEPEMVVESVTSQLADGDIQRVVRHGNRTYVLEVVIEGETLGQLAASEALLRSTLRRERSELRHNPGDGLTPASVYEIQTAQLTPKRDDTDESHLLRRFTVTLTCAPWARSADLTTVTALAPPPPSATTATINNADTPSGWSGVTADFLVSTTQTPVTVVDMGDYQQVSASGSWLRLYMTLATSSISMSSTRYLLVQVSGSLGFTGFRATLNGVDQNVTPIVTRALTSGATLYVFDTAGASFSGLRLGYDLKSPTPVTRTINVHDVSRSNTIPQVTARQNAAVVQIGGTERTPCSLQVNPASGESMGLAIVHTSPESGIGYSPALRQRRTSGNAVTSSAALVSGGSEPVNANPIVAQIPLTSVPEDGYVLCALMRSTVAGTFPITWQVRTFFSGNYLGGQSGLAQATFADPNLWTLIPLAVVMLPPIRASQQAFVQLNLNRTVVGSEVVDLDEWWAFRAGDDCGLTIVQSTASFLWLDSPDVTSPVPRVWVGVNGDRSDARHPGAGLLAQGNHVLHPGGTSVFVATTGIQNPSVTATAYRRWHSNAAS